MEVVRATNNVITHYDHMCGCVMFAARAIAMDNITRDTCHLIDYLQNTKKIYRSIINEKYRRKSHLKTMELIEWVRIYYGRQQDPNSKMIPYRSLYYPGPLTAQKSQ